MVWFGGVYIVLRHPWVSRWADYVTSMSFNMTWLYGCWDHWSRSYWVIEYPRFMWPLDNFGYWQDDSCMATVALMTGRRPWVFKWADCMDAEITGRGHIELFNIWGFCDLVIILVPGRPTVEWQLWLSRRAESSDDAIACRGSSFSKLCLWCME